VANMKTKLFQLGASVPVGTDGKVLASYGHSTEKMPTADVKHAILTLGYDHNLSKRTDLYAVYMNDKEDVKGWKAGNTYAFGIRTKF
jgi:predicted porin